ncbi:WbqC family protein [Calditrichota bacterium LG25]
MILSTFRPAFLPDLMYFWQMSQCQIAIFADHLPFSKGARINRSAPLNTPQDVLTIPVQHETSENQIFKRKVAEQTFWKQKHVKSLRHLFHNFPFAEYYLPEIEDLYGTDFVYLGDLLFELHLKLVKWLHLPLQIYRSSKLDFKGDASRLVGAWCKQFQCEAYIAPEQTFKKQWIDARVLKAQNIRALLFAPLPHSTFLENYARKSILHFILQFGPEAGYILKQYSRKQRKEYSP